jgi:hypothetical protein
METPKHAPKHTKSTLIFFSAPALPPPPPPLVAMMRRAAPRPAGSRDEHSVDARTAAGWRQAARITRTLGLLESRRQARAAVVPG